MLPGIQWKVDALLRLLLSVFICIYAGSVVASVLQYAPGPDRASPAAVYGLGAAALAVMAYALWLAGKPASVEQLLRRLGLALILFYAGMIAAMLVQKLAGPPAANAGRISISALSFQGGTLLLMTRFLREHQVGWGEAFGFQHRLKRACIAGALVALLFLPVSWGLQHTSALVISQLQQWGVRAEEQQAVQALRSAVSSMDRLKMAVVTILLAPLAEEVLFRGLLYAWIRQIGYPRLALWVTAATFALVHFNIATFLPLFVLAVILAVLYERTGNLLAPIAAHSTFNALNFILLLWMQSRPV